jgi:hypothetical protein
MSMFCVFTKYKAFGRALVRTAKLLLSTVPLFSFFNIYAD